MHLLLSLIICGGFVFVVCLGLIKAIYDLSEMNVSDRRKRGDSE